jgi:UDP-2,4-diacetamido-2,4,6-trideoxy-beta-L-altropyranose hydrolase
MAVNVKPLLVRADANARTGIGHLMRCLALAQEWHSRGGEVTFITACDSGSLRQRLSGGGFQTVLLERCHPDPSDWAVTSEVLARHPDTWVVLDGYHFDPDYQLHIRAVGHRLLVIDDTAHLDRYYADVLLNQNIYASQLDYVCEPYTRLLLGSRYVLLRSEFQAWREWQREVPRVARKVLVTLGGGDPDNQTLKVVRALKHVDVDELQAVVVVGASNPHYRELEVAIRDSLIEIRLVRDAGMPELMAWADVAVTAGGTTCWEAAFLGLPSVLLVLADNQRDVATGLHERGIATSLGWWEQVNEAEMAQVLGALMKDVTRRIEMSQSGRNLVDGRGGEQTLDAMEEMVHETNPHW